MNLSISSWGRLAVSLACAALTVGNAQASVTVTPALPAQVSLGWTLTDDLGAPTVALQASGTATIQDGLWTANVVASGDGLIRLGDDAGLSFKLTAFPASAKQPIWKDITIDVAHQTLRADAYVDGVRVADDRQLFFIGGLEGTPDGLPQGKTFIWASTPTLCQLSNPSCGAVTLWDPVTVGTLSISAVPEPSTLLSMALGLVAVTAGVRRGRAPGGTR